MTLDVVVTDKIRKAGSGPRTEDLRSWTTNSPRRSCLFRPVGGAGAAADPPVEVHTAHRCGQHRNSQMWPPSEIKSRSFSGEAAGPGPASIPGLFTGFGNNPGPYLPEMGNAVIADLDRQPIRSTHNSRSQGVYGVYERISLSLNALGQIAGPGSDKTRTKAPDLD